MADLVGNLYIPNYVPAGSREIPVQHCAAVEIYARYIERGFPHTIFKIAEVEKTISNIPTKLIFSEPIANSINAGTFLEPLPPVTPAGYGFTNCIWTYEEVQAGVTQMNVVTAESSSSVLNGTYYYYTPSGTQRSITVIASRPTGDGGIEIDLNAATVDPFLDDAPPLTRSPVEPDRPRFHGARGIPADPIPFLRLEVGDDEAHFFDIESPTFVDMFRPDNEYRRISVNRTSVFGRMGIPMPSLRDLIITPNDLVFPDRGIIFAIRDRLPAFRFNSNALADQTSIPVTQVDSIRTSPIGSRYEYWKNGLPYEVTITAVTRDANRVITNIVISGGLVSSVPIGTPLRPTGE